MLKAKRVFIASAFIATWSAAYVYGQTAPDGGDANAHAPFDVRANDDAVRRASAVIRAIESDSPAARPIPFAAEELVGARAPGDMQAAERGEPIRVERIRIDDPVRSGARASEEATTRGSAAGRVPARKVDRTRMVRADGESTDRTKTSAVVRLDDAQRYREEARYEAEKKRRNPTATAANEQPAPAVRSAQSKAEITWSAPAEQRDYRTATEGGEPTLY